MQVPQTEEPQDLFNLDYCETVQKASNVSEQPQGQTTSTPVAQETQQQPQVSQPKTLLDSLQYDPLPIECPQHPEESLQFYCYNNGKVVCAECLVKGGYSGLDISNLRKAAEKLKGKFTELVNEAISKNEVCCELGKELATHEVQIEENFAKLKDNVKEQMEALRQAVTRKEQELLEKLDAGQEEKVKAVKTVEGNLQTCREEIEMITELINNKVRDLNDVNVCYYYVKAAGVVNDHLNEKVSVEIEQTRRLLRSSSLQDKVNLNRLFDECKKLQQQINNVGTEITKNKYEVSSPYFSEKPKTAVKDSFTASQPSSSLIKDDGETERNRISRQNFFSQCLNQLQPSSHTSSFLGKLIQGELSSPKISSRQPSARSPIMLEMSRYDQNRVEYKKNFASKYGSPIKESSKERLSTKSDLYEFLKNPKGSSRDVRVNEATVLTTKLSPRKNLQESAGVLKVNNKQWPRETSGEQKSTYKTLSDSYFGKEKGVYAKNNMRSEIFSSFERSKTLNNNKILNSSSNAELQGRDSLTMRQSNFKEKLEKLSSKMFN